MNFADYRGGFVENEDRIEALKRASAALKGRSFHSRQALVDAKSKLVHQFLAEIQASK